MAITQRFYPSFFQAALNGTPDLFSTNTLNGKIFLMKVGAEFNIEHINYAEISAFEVADSLKNISILLEIDSVTQKMNFTVPLTTWAAAPTEPFYHAVITDSKEELLFMHFDFDGEKNPLGEFSLTPGACIPHINFEYQTCPP